MSNHSEKFAVHWVPASTDGLTHFGVDWMGWCSDQGHAGNPGRFDDLGLDIPELTRFTCRNGIHAVLKAPFRLSAEHSGFLLEHRVARLAESAAAFRLPKLRLTVIDGRVALEPDRPCPGLAALIARIGTALAPLAPAPEPRGFEDPPCAASFGAAGTRPIFMLPTSDAPPFFLPLTDPLDDATANTVLDRLRPVLAPILDEPRWLRDIALMGDPGIDQPLWVLQRYDLREAPAQRSVQALFTAGPHLLAPMLSDRQRTFDLVT
jgi:hypothetical protein